MMAAHPLAMDSYQSLPMLCLGVLLLNRYLVRVCHVAGSGVGSGHAELNSLYPPETSILAG